MGRTAKMIVPHKLIGLRLAALCIVALMLAPLSCAKRVGIRQDDVAPPKRSLSRTELTSKLETVNQSHKSIKTFSMSLVMSISRQNAFPMSKSFRCEAVCEAPDKLRMKGYAGGMVPAFDLLTKWRKVRLFLPTRNELIEGTRSRFKDLPIVQKHGIGPLLEAELAHLFVPKLPDKDIFWESAPEGVWLYKNGSHHGAWQRTLLDFTTFLPVRREIFSESGELLLEVQFSDYRPVEQAQCPFQLELVSKTNGFKVKMVISSMKANMPLAGGAFSMRVPHGVTKISPDEIETKIQEPADSP